jgi:hypothetical protein
VLLIRRLTAQTNNQAAGETSNVIDDCLSAIWDKHSVIASPNTSSPRDREHEKCLIPLPGPLESKSHEVRACRAAGHRKLLPHNRIAEPQATSAGPEENSSP